MLKIYLEDDYYDELIEYCDSMQCKYCPFGETGYYHGLVKCAIGDPGNWECEELEDNEDE